MNWILENADGIGTVIAAIWAIFTFISAITPTKTDDGWKKWVEDKGIIGKVLAVIAKFSDRAGTQLKKPKEES